MKRHEWAAHVAAWKRSAQTASEYGEPRGLSGKKLYWWSWHLKGKDGDKGSPAVRTPRRRGGPMELVPVTLRPVRHAAQPDTSSGNLRGEAQISAIRSAAHVLAEVRILVTDVNVPGLDVSELCDRFRAATQGRRTGIVLVSARSDAELQNCLHTTGADDFVPKGAGTSAVVNRVLALSKDISS